MKTLAEDLFVQAHELEPAARDAFLAEACGYKTDLHLEVQRMLVDAKRADSFFADADEATLGAQQFKDTYAEKEGDFIGPTSCAKPSARAASYFDAGRKDEALKLREEVLALTRRVIGPEHPHTLRAMNGLALSYDDAGRKDEAAKLRAELVATKAKQ